MDIVEVHACMVDTCLVFVLKFGTLVHITILYIKVTKELTQHLFCFHLGELVSVELFFALPVYPLVVRVRLIVHSCVSQITFANTAIFLSSLDVDSIIVRVLASFCFLSSLRYYVRVVCEEKCVLISNENTK